MSIVDVYNPLDRLKIAELEAQAVYFSGKIATLEYDVAESHRIIDNFRKVEPAVLLSPETTPEFYCDFVSSGPTSSNIRLPVPGDVVALKSGSVDMTIFSVGDTCVEVCWMDHNGCLNKDVVVKRAIRFSKKDKNAADK